MPWDEYGDYYEAGWCPECGLPETVCGGRCAEDLPQYELADEISLPADTERDLGGPIDVT